MADNSVAAALNPKKSVPIMKWVTPVIIGWLVPGGGHIYQGRMQRGLLLGISTIICFLIGLLMRGAFFEPQTGDILTTLI